MGIDIEIRVGLKRKPTEEERAFLVNRWDGFLTIDGELDTIPAVEHQDPWSPDRETPKGFEEIYRISSLTRYYGEGYERGPAVLIYGTLVFLTEIFSTWEPTVYYGHDEDPWQCEVTPEFLKDFISYAAANGREPYTKRFN